MRKKIPVLAIQSRNIGYRSNGGKVVLIAFEWEFGLCVGEFRQTFNKVCKTLIGNGCNRATIEIHGRKRLEKWGSEEGISLDKKKGDGCVTP
jgi:hypothetical protein